MLNLIATVVVSVLLFANLKVLQDTAPAPGEPSAGPLERFCRGILLHHADRLIHHAREDEKLYEEIARSVTNPALIRRCRAYAEECRQIIADTEAIRVQLLRQRSPSSVP